MRIGAGEVYRYSLPLNPPLALRNRQLEQREGLLLRLISEDGLEAWGEAAPLPGFSPEPIERIERELVALMARMPGYRFADSYAEMEGAPLVRISGACSLSFAVEACYFGLKAAEAGVPLFHYLGASEGRVPLNALLAGTAEQVLEKAGRVAGEGFGAAKLKVGGRPLAEDIELVHEVRRLIGPEMELRLDANRAWHILEGIEFGQAVRDCGIVYLEEPLKDPLKLIEWRKRAEVPYALDETLHSFHQVLLQRRGGEKLPPTEEMAGRARLLVRLFEHAEAVVWKPTLAHVPNMGADLLRGEFALPIRRVVLSASFESGLGLGLVGHYAAAFSGRGVACGLDTYSWLGADILDTPLPIRHGVLHLEETPARPRLESLTRVA